MKRGGEPTGLSSKEKHIFDEFQRISTKATTHRIELRLRDPHLDNIMTDAIVKRHVSTCDLK